MKELFINDKSSGKRRVILSLSSVVAIALLSGCGGVPEGYIDADTLDAYAESVVVAKQRVNNGVAIQPNAAPQAALNAGAISSSFTLTPTENFKGFNHEMWNGRKSWYECSCGDDVREMPQMRWNPA